MFDARKGKIATSMALGAAASTLLASQAWAATDSVITGVTVFPGVAQVTRQASLAAGGQALTFDCLPAGINQQALTVEAGAGVQVGEISVERLDSEQARHCLNSPLDKDIERLEDELAVLDAEKQGLELSVSYLRGLGGGKDQQAVAPSGSLASMLGTVKAEAGNAFRRMHSIEREKQRINERLLPLTAERDRLGNSRRQISRVTIRTVASKPSNLALIYQVSGPTWQSAYRAYLDSASSSIQLERQAMVQQSTGEDWKGVALRLSTGQPRRGASAPYPSPWTIGIAVPLKQEAAGFMSRQRGLAAADAALAEPMAAASPAPAELERDFTVEAIDTAFRTEFVAPQRLDIPSNGERVGLTLETRKLQSKLFIRTVPSRDASAWLMAEAKAPDGIWPAGQLQLYRDQAYVGAARLGDPDKQGLWEMPFGQDERVAVTVLPEDVKDGTRGLTGSRMERSIKRVFEIENRHKDAIDLQVLEAAPSSRHEDVDVALKFQPEPQSGKWRDLPGVVEWRTPLAPGKTARFEASYVYSWPEDATLTR
ncbi:DUF4139 domain-containing protein [Hydrogenophaga sp. 5NK40-0174]|uniref:DUF4139 domain-containing protein n=1 Tax=Hydrogenophaga sp. 5NK40-0174 TaxID=3127649 RepID=UPI00310A6943